MRPSLDALPLETFEHITAYLDHDGLLGLSCVNKACRYATRPQLFRRVSLTFDSPESLSSAVRAASDVLSSAKSFAQVQHLEIRPQHLYDYSILRLADCGDRPLDTWKFCRIDHRRTNLITKDTQWQTLVAFVRQLPALCMMIWGAYERIPCNILEHLNRKAPRCHLEIRNLQLRDLGSSVIQTGKMEPDRLKLVTSPCLYSITMQHDDAGGRDPAAIMEISRSVAPNLKEVKLLWQSSGACPDPLSAAGTQIPNSGISINSLSSLTEATGALCALELVEQNTGQSLRSWSTVTNFSLLKSLKTHYSLGSSDFRWLVEHCQFRSLEVLAINPQTYDDEDDSWNELADSVEAFIMSLPRLTSIKMVGQYRQRTLDLLLDHCGRQLRCLLLGLPEDSSKQDSFLLSTLTLTKSLREKCPLLEELAIPILRSQGCEQEVKKYTNLGRLTKIRKLHLSLYCSQPFVWDQDLRKCEAYDDAILAGEKLFLHEVKEALIDLAVDKNLAGSIFHTISTAKDPYEPRLERLHLRVDAPKECGGYESWYKMINIFQYIGRSWTCDRNVRDDAPHQCFVTAYHSQDECSRKWLEDEGDMDHAARTHFSHLLWSIWPEAADRDWKEVWHSFPLATCQD